MSTGLRIVVADDERDMRDFFAEFVPMLGHQVVAAAATGGELVELCRQHKPDLVITDVRMPDMDGVEAAARVCRERPVPVILVSAYRAPDVLARAEGDSVMAYLVKPIKEKDLEPAIVLAMRRFEQFQALRKEADDLRQALEDRKAIERAKGAVMRRAGLDEQEAFRRLQRLASEKGRKLVEVAQMVLVAEEAFAAGRPAG